MPMRELIAGSTYPFASTLHHRADTRDCRSVVLEANWIINDEYDLELVHGNHKLIRSDLGGLGYLLAVTTGFDCNINSIGITFQNHTLTIDEAFTEAERLHQWLSIAGFRQPTPAEQKAEHMPNPFGIEQALRAPPYAKKITNYAEARAALLDPQANVEKVMLSSGVSGNTEAMVWVNRARRGENEDAASEREYRVYFDLGAREIILD